MPELLVNAAWHRAVAVSIIYPHRSGLATRVRVVGDLVLNDMRRNRILNIDKFA